MASGRQFLPRPAAPVQNKPGAPTRRGGFGHGIHAASAGSAVIFRLHDPKRQVPRFAHLGQILMIGAALALAGFLAALITAILTYSAG